MPILSGALLIGAAATAAGDYMSYSGQQAANADNEQENQENINAAMDRQQQAEGYNTAQNQVTMNFDAAQQQNAQAFSAQQVQQAEEYDTQMSDTAMQRRVADLQQAGINPLLAVSQGGASTPLAPSATGTPVTAPQASASPAGQGSSIPMQNPSAALGNLGGQVNSALQAQQIGAQTDLIRAQTEKTQAEAGTEIPANIDYLKSMTGLNQQNAQVAANQIDLVKQNVLNASATESQIQAETALKNELATQAYSNTDILKATKDALISATQSDATAKQLGLSQLRNLNDVQNSSLGRILTYINAVLQPVNTAAHAAGQIVP